MRESRMAALDPNNEQLHRVRMDMLTQYKDGVIEKVMAYCGKVWEPKFPIVRMHKVPRCPICFPVERYRYAIAK
jgi:hypothetical protein